MKAAYKDDFEAILEIFRFWQEKGFTDKKAVVLFFLRYISQTQDLKTDKLKKILDKSKMNGGDLMPTLAQRFEKEFLETLGPQLISKGKRTGKREGKREGKIEGKIEGKKEAAIRMMERGFDLDSIIYVTGLKKSEIEKLAPHSRDRKRGTAHAND